MKELNRHAYLREYLFLIIDNLSAHSPNDLSYQSSLLANLSQSTNQLTRRSAVKRIILYFIRLKSITICRESHPENAKNYPMH